MKIICIRILQSLIILFISNSSHSLTFSGGQGNIVHQASTQILEKAYKKINIHPDFSFAQLQESLNHSNSGQVDGEVSRVKKITKKYPNLVEVPVVINYVEAVAFGKSDHLNIHSWEDLSPYNIAIIRGTKFIEHGTQNLKRILTNSFDESFKLLNDGKVDLVVAPRITGIFIIYNNKYKHLRQVSSVLQRLDLYHFLHKKNMSLIPKITPILQLMKDQGEIDYLRTRYFEHLLSQ